MSNKNLNKAKSEKDDEFYTRLEDIEAELKHYKHHFNGKVVACNCDDPRWSNFTKYFKTNFQALGLRGLISLFHGKDAFAEVLDPKHGVRTFSLKDSGDFRTKEAQWFLNQADIVVTNPPFSLFRDYVKQLLDLEKQFLIVGPIMQLGTKYLFQQLQQEKVWIGTQRVPEFVLPDKTLKAVPALWWTTLDYEKRHQPLTLKRTYTPQEYPTYDQYPAIDVKRTLHIPNDYQGLMGVPITYLEKHNPDVFEIIEMLPEDKKYIQGKRQTMRVVIQRKP